MNEIVLGILRYLFTVGIPSVLILIVIIALLKVYVLPAFFTNRKKQESKQTAYVLKKREEVLSGSAGIYSIYMIMFKIENDSIELRVPKNIFTSLDSGDKGELKNEGDKFVGFDVIEKSTDKTENQMILVGETMRSSLNIIEQKEKE